MLDKLKELRMKVGFSDSDMAKMLGISKTFYWQIENGKRGLKYLMAIRIAEIFGLKPDNLFYEDLNKLIKEEKKQG
jgi:putative transcriptional regulator